MIRHGRVRVSENQIIIKNPEACSDYARVTPCKGCTLYVNGVEKKQTVLVKEEDNVFISVQNEEAVRNATITYSEDKVKAYLTLEYKNGVKYDIEDSEEKEDLTLSVKEYAIIPTLYNENEILNLLKKEGITYGIKFETIKYDINTYDVKTVTIAEGVYPIEAVDDEIYFLDNDDKRINTPKTIYDTVDYKNLNNIHNVSEGTIIAKIKKGFSGTNGTDVFGKNISPKKKVYKEILCGKGCEKQGDKILSTINGQVFFKNNKVNVNEIYKVEKDVDMSTGNINFNGDIIVKGNVTEGMQVTAQNNIQILGSVFNSSIISKGDVSILGNIMSSKISAGGKDIIKEARLNSLLELYEILQEIIKTVDFLISKNILNQEQKLGMVIKGLIDTKFNQFHSIVKNTMVYILRDDDAKSKTLKFIKSKLIGISFMNINKLSEMIEGLEIIQEEIDILRKDEYIESSVTLMYCQESFIQSTNDIQINGKGTFSSQFYSGGQVIFKDTTSVCRGGKIKAKNYIKAAIVGSEGGVQTILQVENKSGSIKIDKAFNNTKIIIGTKENFINVPSRDINCYIDKDGELIIEKFVL